MPQKGWLWNSRLTGWMHFPTVLRN
jgi:hypothetical protein